MRRRFHEYSRDPRRKLHDYGHRDERIVPGLDHGNTGGAMRLSHWPMLRTRFCEPGSAKRVILRTRLGTRTNSMWKAFLPKTVALLLLVAGFTAPQTAWAQSGSRVEAGVDYNYVRSNAPAGGCGCFALNGGSAWLAFNFSRSLGVVGEIASQNASNVSSSGADLTLTSFLAGPRYTWTRDGRFAPFAQALLGGAHAGRTLAPGSS